MSIIGIHLVHNWKETPLDTKTGTSAVYYIYEDATTGSRSELATMVHNNEPSANLIASNLSGMHNVPVRVFNSVRKYSYTELPVPVTPTENP